MLLTKLPQQATLIVMLNVGIPPTFDAWAGSHLKVATTPLPPPPLVGGVKRAGWGGVTFRCGPPHVEGFDGLSPITNGRPPGITPVLDAWGGPHLKVRTTPIPPRPLVEGVQRAGMGWGHL